MYLSIYKLYVTHSGNLPANMFVVEVTRYKLLVHFLASELIFHGKIRQYVYANSLDVCMAYHGSVRMMTL